MSIMDIAPQNRTPNGQEGMLKKRPLMVTPWAIWIKPGLKLRFHFFQP